MQVSNAQDAFVQELSAAVATERTLVEALEEFSPLVTNETLKTILESHLEETRGHVARVEGIFEHLGLEQTGGCSTSEELLEEARGNVEGATTDAARDLVIAHWSLKAEAMEVAGYTTLFAAATQSGMAAEVTEPLEFNLNEDQDAYDEGRETAPELVKAAQG